MKLLKWLTSEWAIRNLPTIIAIVGKFTDTRKPAPGTWTKPARMSLAAALIGATWACAIPQCVKDGSCIPDIPSPPPTTLPAPSPSPEGSPSPLPEASPSPSPSPSPSAPPAPVPSPSPCIQASSAPTCVQPEGCVSCADFIAYQLAHGHLTRLPNGLLYNDPGGDPSRREYVDPRTCFYVWADGSLRNKRLHKDGSVCPDCPPTPQATPCPSPSAPSASPTPTPSGAPPLTESGNYPMPRPGEECPPWFAGATVEIGISVEQQQKCNGRDAPPDCTKTKLNATEKSVTPHCEHSCYDTDGVYALSNCKTKCETVRNCQQPQYVDGNTGILMTIWGPQVERGACDKFTVECGYPDCRINHLCHDQAINRRTETNAQACMPDGTKCGPVRQYWSLQP